MQRLLLAVDKLSTRIGQLFAWLIVVLTVLITWEVLSRKFFDAPHAWAFDAQIMGYGVLFMMAGAYTLAKNGHVRGDVLYGFFPPRAAGDDRPRPVRRSSSCPGRSRWCGRAGRTPTESWVIREHSTITVDGPPIYPFKAFIPIAGALILVQGVVEIVRCVVAPQERRVAVAPAGRRGGRRRQAEGDGPREGRGHRRARRGRACKKDARGGPAREEGALVRPHAHGPHRPRDGDHHAVARRR